MTPNVQPFLDQDSETYSYVVYDKDGGYCAIIDPVLDFDYKSGRTSTEGADKIIAFVQAQELHVSWILETHAHADHISAATYLRKHIRGCLAIGKNIIKVQKIFAELFNFGETFIADGHQFDHLFDDDASFIVGDLNASVLFTPGHTPADLTYIIGNAIFVGDTLFMPDVGTARCDFPGGDAHTLYQSVQKILALPDKHRLFVCHDYPGDNRSHHCETTVEEQRESNIHINENVTEEEFVAMRETRDASLEMPRLILPSIQLNVRAGELPDPESNGTRYLKIPLNAL